ncbi:hypothetical protein LS73_006785 [Helicobacter muridarum]|uniref:Sialidase n=1 Tax=Helicobacter muridarum TaxID=216 RepID=A0A377PVU2_9HELI|nr:hypothetical protein [Helicobacter muridarum]TLD99770.1 hypothetical protein LS73_006785 [Helicobacter muridarum]STQ86996.1 sialidase [Helicobacter muridarum]
MQDFDKLKEMDIQELHSKTRITVSKLQDIINKNFANIHHIRAHGFIKILERELNLNLKSWIEEYEQYQKYNNLNAIPKKVESKVSPSSTQDTKDIKDIEISTNTKHKTYSNKTKEPKNDIDTHEITPKDSPKVNEKQSRPIIKTKKSYIPSKPSVRLHSNKDNRTKKIIVFAFILTLVILLIIITIIYNMNNDTTNKEVIIEQAEEIIPSKRDLYPRILLEDALLDRELNENSNKAQPENIMDNKTDKNQTETSKSEKSEELAQTANTNGLESTLTIIPKTDVWFAWVDLDTKQNGEKYTKTSFSIQTKGDIIFHFGNMILTFNINGEDYSFNKGSVTYMLYSKNFGLKEISQKEYNSMKKKAI